MTKGEFLNLLCEMLEVPPGSLKGPERLGEEVEVWDSLAVVSFLALADEHLGLMLAPKKVAGCKTVDDLVGLLGEAIKD